ncbi:MAG TPA: hypothetical protein VLA02_11500 [Reyranella sp.]|nr:hypothetical protein [Reyranella sp.]
MAMDSALVRFPDRLASLVDSPWANAGGDPPSYGAALDRLFGTADDSHLLEHFAAADPIVVFDDPLVLLANLIEGVSLSAAEPVMLPMPELAAVYDFAPGVDAFHLHDTWSIDSPA